MAGKGTCAKCGITAKQSPSLKFHRFPHVSRKYGSLRAKVWAKFCFPDEDWISDEALESLHKQHKMLCEKHFDDTSYINRDKTRLSQFAVPTEAQNLLAQLREERDTPRVHQDIVEMEVVAGTSTSVERSKSLRDEQYTLQHQAMEVETVVVAGKSTSLEQDEQYTPQHQTVEVEEKKPRKGILQDLNLKKTIQLSPRKRKLYAKCRKSMSEIFRLRAKIKKIKQCKRSVLSALASNNAVDHMMKRNLSSSFYLLLQSQLKNVPRKLTGRRWSVDDKVLALGIYKKSSSCYRLLRRLFCLPSVSSLKMLLNKIPLVCGINAQVVETVKEIASKRADNENMCMVAFDEMSIRKNLTYNTKLDQLDGYQDHARQGRTPQIASHALTFMAIGLRKNWKQPIAFYFSGECVTADRLSVLIKEVILT